VGILIWLPDYGLNCFTASTQRPQIVGCSGFEPTSVSQCQQRSHFWPPAFFTVQTGRTPPRSNLTCETLANSRKSSLYLSAISAFVFGATEIIILASSALPMALAWRLRSNSGKTELRNSKRLFQSARSASKIVNALGCQFASCTDPVGFPGTNSHASSAVKARIGASIWHRLVTSRYSVVWVERRRCELAGSV